MSKYLYLIIAIFITSNLVSQVAITIPAEYEKSEKLLITWPYSPEIDSIVSEIIKISREITKVEILCDPSNPSDTTMIRNFLLSQNANGPNVTFIPAHTNTSWIRQYSPVFGYGVFTDTLVRYIGNPGFANYYRPADDSVPKQLADFWNMDFTNYGLQYENSNLQYDGLRNIFVGSRILNENIPMSANDIIYSLNSFYNSGIVTLIPTPMYSGGGDLNGLSNYLKILDFETLLLTSLPDTLPDYLLLEEMENMFSSLTTNYGNSYNIIRIPAAPNDDGTFTTSSNGEFRSYTNSLILNDLIIIPSFDQVEYDSIAMGIYQEHMPGYSIHFVDARTLSEVQSGIHTITKEVPQPSYLRILHSKMIGAQEFYPEVKINTLCGSATQVENMWLYYKKNSDTAYTKEEIHLVCPQHFAVIDKLTPTDTIHYYIEAISSETQTTYPLSAPEGNFTFWFDVVSDTENEIITESFNISPNPSSGKFTITEHSNNSNELLIKIFNTQGQLVHSSVRKPNAFIDIETELGTGYYTLVIESGELTSVHKLIILDR